jgi:bacterioferritin-associated ferredoxin
MRIAAGDNLLDPTLLAQLASAVDENGYLGAYERADVRRSAARRLAQSPGWILEITDQATLAAVAVAYETDAGIRQAALSQLTDQAALTKVIIAHSDCSDCKAAIDKLTSQILLAKVATESRDPRVRILAVAKLTNQAVLARVAAKDPSEKVRQAAHARILR